MTPAPTPNSSLFGGGEVAHLRRVNTELFGTVTDLPATAERSRDWFAWNRVDRKSARGELSHVKRLLARAISVRLR